MSIGTNIEMGKVYAGEAQIGEIYRGSELMYKAEVVVFDGVALTDGYTYESKGYNSKTHGLFYAKSRYNDAGGKTEEAYCYVPVDCTGYEKLTVEYSAVVSAYGNAIVRLCNVALASLSSSEIKKLENDAVHVFSTDITTDGVKEETIDISDISGVKYLAVGTYNTQGNQTDAVITRVVLE